MDYQSFLNTRYLQSYWFYLKTESFPPHGFQKDDWITFIDLFLKEEFQLEAKNNMGYFSQHSLK